MKNKLDVCNVDSPIQSSFSSWVLPVIQIVLGSIFLGIMAQVAIPLPFTPVPISLQTLAVALLAMTLGPKKAPLAVIVYLTQATIGLPVLAGGTVNPLWIMGPTSGYLIGFLVASFITSSLFKSYASNGIKIWAISFLNEVMIVLCGSIGLGFLIGWQKAFLLGALPFLPGAFMKSVVTTLTFKPVEWIKSKL